MRPRVTQLRVGANVLFGMERSCARKQELVDGWMMIYAARW